MDGRPITVPTALVYLALNKPPGYLTTAADERGRPAVLDLLPRLPALLLEPLGLVLLWPLFYATQWLLGRKQPLTWSDPPPGGCGDGRHAGR